VRSNLSLLHDAVTALCVGLIASEYGADFGACMMVAAVYLHFTGTLRNAGRGF
jgi:hypothetical protein